MHETYTMVGRSFDTPLAWMFVGMLGVMFISQSIKTKMVQWIGMIGLVCTGFLVTRHMPMEFLYGALAVTLGLSASVSPPMKTRAGRIAVPIIYFGCAVLMCCMTMLVMPFHITLSDTKLESQWKSDRIDVARDKLRVAVDWDSPVGNDPPIGTFYGKGGPDDKGPIVYGGFTFLGPNGLVTGNELGQRMADWAGVKLYAIPKRVASKP